MLSETQIRELIEHYKKKYENVAPVFKYQVTDEIDCKLNFIAGYANALEDILNGNYNKNRH